MDYGPDFQHLLINVLMSEPDIFVRCQNILKSDYFQSKHAKAVQFILEYSQKYSTLPTPEEVTLKSSLGVSKIENIAKNNYQGFLDTIEDFCRHKALEKAVIDGMEFVKKKQYGKVEFLVKEAMMVSLQRDLGTDYFFDPEERNTKLFSTQGTISTGWKDVDYRLFGGFGTGELEIFVAPSGGGKSIALQNLSLNFAKRKMNGVYLSLELKEEMVAQRMDSMLTGRTKQEIISDMSTASAEVQVLGKNMGELFIKRLPENITTVNDIRAYIKELQIRKGLDFQYIAVDYLDLLGSPRVDPSDVFMKDKYVCEELRALAFELDITIVTASQLNRSAVESEEYNHSNIAGGISKIYTADNVIGIFNTPALRERNEIHFQYLKTRNSNGVGMKSKMGYNPDTLLIDDHVDPTGLSSTVPTLSAQILSKKNTLNAPGVQTPTPAPPTPAVSQMKNSSDQLRALIKKSR